MTFVHHPGLREGLEQQFKLHPTKDYDIGELKKSAKGVSKESVQYHVNQLAKAGIIERTRRGWYKLAETQPKSVEEIRAEVAAMPKRVVLSEDGFKHGQENGIRAVDTMWHKLLKRQLDSILARMESTLPAKELFAEPDHDTLRDLVTWVIEGRPNLHRQVEA